MSLSRLSFGSRLLVTGVCVAASTICAQDIARISDGDAQAELEEVVVVGTQIKGAAINTALPVTIISSDEIDNTLNGLIDNNDLLEKSKITTFYNVQTLDKISVEFI